MTKRQRYRKRKNKFERFMELLMEYKLVSICVAVVLVAGCTFGAILLFSEPTIPASAPSPPQSAEIPPTEQPTTDALDPATDEEYQALIESGQIDADTLAGLTGDDGSSDFVGGDVIDANIIGLMAGQDASSIADSFGESAQENFVAGDIDEFMVYTHSEDINQRVQDLRSMINKGCKVVVLANSDEYFFSIATQIAEQSGVQVVAVNAPSSDGYDINITTGDSDFTGAHLEHLSQAPMTGDVYTVAGSQTFADSAQEAFTFPEYKGTIFTGADTYEQDMSAAFSAPLYAVITDSASGLSTLDFAIKSENLPSVFATTATAGIIKKWQELSTTGVDISPEADEGEEQPPPQLVRVGTSQLYAIAQVSDDETGSAAADIAVRLLQGGALLTDTFELSGTLAITNADLSMFYEVYKDDSADTRITVPLEDSVIDALFAEVQ